MVNPHVQEMHRDPNLDVFNDCHPQCTRAVSSAALLCWFALAFFWLSGVVIGTLVSNSRLSDRISSEGDVCQSAAVQDSDCWR